MSLFGALANIEFWYMLLLIFQLQSLGVFFFFWKFREATFIPSSFLNGCSQELCFYMFKWMDSEIHCVFSPMDWQQRGVHRNY